MTPQTNLDRGKSPDESCPLVTVALCTYFRPEKLDGCLESLIRQDTKVPYEIVVVDNDANGSARTTVEDRAAMAADRGIVLTYHIEPEQSISLARNRAIAAARGDWVALIDDDEVADPGWLDALVRCARAEDADGVWGPVVKTFPEKFPRWLQASKYFFRPQRVGLEGELHEELASNNAVLRREMLQSRPGPFDPKYGRIGGSDTELFEWLDHHGFRFFACPDAIVREEQPLSRASLRWMMRRGYRVGFVQSSIHVQHRGCVQGVAWVLRALVGDLVRVPIMMVQHIWRPRLLIWLLPRHLARQAGRIGYFLSVRIIEYRNRVKTQSPSGTN